MQVVPARTSCTFEKGSLKDPYLSGLQVVQIWRKELSKINAKAAESLADPGQYANLFPDFDLALKAEQHQRQQKSEAVPAKDFADHEGSTFANLIDEVRGKTQTSDRSLAAVAFLLILVLCSMQMLQGDVRLLVGLEHGSFGASTAQSTWYF